MTMMILICGGKFGVGSCYADTSWWLFLMTIMIINSYNYEAFISNLLILWIFCNLLNSFSVPYDLSMGGSKEQWAEAFLVHMQEKWERCKPAWRSLEMEVSECYPQAIVL